MKLSYSCSSEMYWKRGLRCRIFMAGVLQFVEPSDDAHDEACTGANRLTDSRGFVYSPGYPKRYSKTPCWWKLFLDRGQDVQFTIFEMQSFFTGSPRDTPDFLRVSPSVPAPSCPFKQRDVVSFQEFRGDVLTVKQFRVRCHLEAEITLRQLSGAGKGVRLLLFYQGKGR